MATGVRRTHDFCWINILTPRPEEARAFFATLLGWEYAEIPGMGHLIELEGSRFGGIFDLASPNTPEGTPPGIGVMVKVEGADSARERAVVLGGTAKAAFDIGDKGRMAELFDPNGAEIDVWEPKANPGMEVDARLHGAPSWFEALTSDVDRAAAFYRELFGWSSEVMSMPGMDYTVFKVGAEDDMPIAGMMKIPEGMGAPPHWATYFTVNDADEAARKALELGATLLMPLADVPQVGRICGITSPQGVTFYVIRYAS